MVVEVVEVVLVVVVVVGVVVVVDPSKNSSWEQAVGQGHQSFTPGRVRYQKLNQTASKKL